MADLGAVALVLLQVARFKVEAGVKDVRFAFFAVLGDDDREAVFAGAHGYVCKSDAGSHLICAIEALIKHKFFFATRRSDDPYDAEFLPSAEPALPVVLTHRENQIVQYLTEGHTNREVASRLGISVKTVETHRTTVMRKLGVHSIVKLVHYAVRNNICSYGTARLQSENLKKMRRLGNSSFAASS